MSAVLQRADRLLHARTGSCSTIKRQRGLVRCSAADERKPETLPLFQLDGRPQSLNMADIMDAYEVCSMIPDPSERHQCYSVFGLDAQRMAAYYDTVVRLEHQLSSDLDSPASVASDHGASLWQQLAGPFGAKQRPGHHNNHHHHHAAAITGSAPPPPAAAAAVAVAMLYIAAQHMAWF